MFIWNILIAIVWCALVGSFNPANIIGGFALGFGILWLMSRTQVISGRDYYQQVPQIIGLTIYFIWELIIANIKLAADLFRREIAINPAIVAMPLDAKTDAEITLVASLITLTPGTLSMEVSEDRRTLFIHAMYADDPEELVASLKNGFERRVLEVLR